MEILTTKAWRDKVAKDLQRGDVLYEIALKLLDGDTGKLDILIAEKGEEFHQNRLKQVARSTIDLDRSFPR